MSFDFHCHTEHWQFYAHHRQHTSYWHSYNINLTCDEISVLCQNQTPDCHHSCQTNSLPHFDTPTSILTLSDSTEKSSEDTTVSFTVRFTISSDTNDGISDLWTRGVRNPMKISDIGFLKNEPNRTDLKIQKPKTRFPRFGFQKTDICGFGTVFHVVSSQFVFQHDEFRFVWLRLRNSKPPAPQPLRTRACPWQEVRCTCMATGDCWWNDRWVAAVKIREIAGLTLETIGILRVELYSRSQDIRPRKSPETTPVCRVTVAVLRYSDASADETRLTYITDNGSVVPAAPI